MRVFAVVAAFVQHSQNIFIPRRSSSTDIEHLPKSVGASVNTQTLPQNATSKN